MMDPKTEKLVRRTTMVATAVASYFLLTADYGPEPNAIDPIKNAILSAERSVKEFIFGSKKSVQENEIEKAPTDGYCVTDCVLGSSQQKSKSSNAMAVNPDEAVIGYKIKNAILSAENESVKELALDSRKSVQGMKLRDRESPNCSFGHPRRGGVPEEKEAYGHIRERFTVVKVGYRATLGAICSKPQASLLGCSREFSDAISIVCSLL
nr:UvrABC system protein A [Ipomoea batatas]